MPVSRQLSVLLADRRSAVLVAAAGAFLRVRVRVIVLAVVRSAADRRGSSMFTDRRGTLSPGSIVAASRRRHKSCGGYVMPSQYRHFVPHCLYG